MMQCDGNEISCKYATIVARQVRYNSGEASTLQSWRGKYATIMARQVRYNHGEASTLQSWRGKHATIMAWQARYNHVGNELQS